MAPADAVTAELSSLATAIDELRRRITAIADDLIGTADDGVALELHQVERALSEAHRRIERVTR